MAIEHGCIVMKTDTLPIHSQGLLVLHCVYWNELSMLPSIRTMVPNLVDQPDKELGRPQEIG